MYNKEHKARKDYTCSKCGQNIQKGGKYVQVDLIPKNKNYHVDCSPKSEVVDEPKVEIKTVETNVAETKVEPEPIKTNAIINRPRNPHGQVRVYNLEVEGKR